MTSCAIDTRAVPDGRGKQRSEPPVAPEPGITARLLAALEPPQHAVTTCPRCDGSHLCRWGTTRRGLQRWRCRDCGQTRTTVTDTALAHLHTLDKLRAVAADMLAVTPRSCRALAAALDLDRMTIWRWRRLIAAAWALLEKTGTALIPGTTILRESRKASREWVRHQQAPERHPAPDRLRWIDYRRQRLPLPQPTSRWQVPVTLPSGVCPPTPPSHAAGRNDRLPAAAPMEQRFRDFLAPFTGPASRHLRTYLAWFEARLASAP